MSSAFAAYEAIAKDTTFDPVNDSDLPRLVPLLDRRPEPGAGCRLARRNPGRLRLSQDAKLRPARTRSIAMRSGYALLPRLIWRLEAQMRGYFTQPDFLYEATRVYLMLGGQGPLDRGPGQGMDDATIGRHLFRRRQSGGRWPRCSSISTRSSPNRCRRCRSTMRWWRRRAPPSAACPWRPASTPASSLPRPRRACRPGSRAMCWGRRACASSRERRARS